MSEDDFNDKLFEAVYGILIKKGVKSTTMDSIARQLQISKRTLYEMFENKTELLTRAMKHHADNHRRKCEEIALNSPNLMESLVKIFKLHRDDISRVSVDFFRDMDRLHPGFRDDYETRHELFRKQMMKMFQYGVEQGVFRNDINFPTFVRIVELQMESVIRMKEIYTGDMSITEVFDTVMICYLRAIASPKGLEILDEAIPKYFPELSSSPHPAPEDENLDNEK